MNESSSSQAPPLDHLHKAVRNLTKSYQACPLHAIRAAGVSPREIYRLTASQLGLAQKEIIDLTDLLPTSLIIINYNSTFDIPSPERPAHP